MTKVPEHLYRYRHLQGEHREYTRRILTDSILYFASPSSFNDPFDCKVHFRKISQSDLRKGYEKILKQRKPELNREGRRVKALNDTRRHRPQDALKFIIKGLQESANQQGILSLSATDRNILLWSHYASGHMGLCLRFLGSRNTPFFGHALPIKYSSVFPEVGLLTSTKWEQVEALLFTKASDWSYEEEWRIIDHTKGPGEKRFPQELLTGVILGARMPQEDRDTVLEWLKGRKSPVDVYEAVVSDKSFSLDIVPYSR
jgi:hypothetical protein